MHTPAQVTWESFGESFAAEAAFASALPVEAWGCYLADTPAPCILSDDLALKRFAELPAGPVQSEWHISLDLAHGLASAPQVTLTDSDFGWYDPSWRTVSQVMNAIENDLALESSA